jgi:hypothetical protein
VPTTSVTFQTSTSPTASTSSTPTARPAGQAPLTGLSVTTQLALSRPVVGVAVAYVPGGSSVGLGAADIVYQEFDRTGHTRLVAVYQSTQASSVGPVGATAPVDLRLLQLFRTPAYAFAGGPAGFVSQVKAPLVAPRSSASFPTLFRVGAGGLVTSTSTLLASDRGAPSPLSGVMTFGSAATPEPTGGPALHRLTIVVPGQVAEVFTWTGSAWAGPGGTRLANVIFQVVLYKSITPHKSPTVGSAQVVGTGEATVIAGQHAAATIWARAQPGLVTTYTIKNVPVGLVPGRTWVLLVPRGTRLEVS